MEECEAIALLKQGDLSGLRELVKRHQVEAVQAAFLIVRDRDAAEDIAQGAFIRAASKIHQFDHGRPFRPWFLRIVMNDAIKITTRRKRFLSLDTLVEAEAPPPWLQDPCPGPEDLADRDEERRKVWDAMQRLTPKERAVIVRKYYLDMSGQEISKTLNQSIGSIKWSLHTARGRLRTILGTDGRSRDSGSHDEGHESDAGEGL